MKGLVRQRGASWELRVYLGRDPVTGKKRYATRLADLAPVDTVLIDERD